MIGSPSFQVQTTNAVGNNQINEALYPLGTTDFNIASGGMLTYGGFMDAAHGDLLKDGGGTLVFGGIGGVPGLILNAGTLVLNRDIVYPPLLGGDGMMTLNGGTLQSAAAPGTFVTLAENVTVAGPASISGNGNFEFTGTWQIQTGQTLTVNNTQTPNLALLDGDLEFAGIVFGLGSVNKMGTGDIGLSGTNTYNGGTTLQGGVLDVNSDNALGTGKLTLDGGTLVRSLLQAETLANPFEVDANTTVEDFSVNYGATSLALTGPGTLSTGTTLTVVVGATLSTDSAAVTVSGSLSGPGGLAVNAAGYPSPLTHTVTLNGTAANTYTGKTTVNSGTLFLSKPANVTAISGPVVIGTGTDLGLLNPIVELQADNQIHRLRPITVNAFGELKLAGHNQQTGSVSGSGKVVTGDPPLFTVGFDNSSTTFDGVISGPGTVDKVGTGTWT
ncbi:MAG TPA: autotransporter-associated beta strand repeat-containing protein, partial [Gemmataceae bacterium]|nr:autotransporter-associated beta strand repeat-containing protein [Gemmataceae bacterium]